MIMIIYVVIGNFRGIFSSVNMLKGVHNYLLKCWRAHAHLSEC